jgi:sugar lactone lactonase YvrE
MRCTDRVRRACRPAGALVVVQAAIAAAQTPPTTLIYPPWSHCYGMHRVNQTHLTLRAGFGYKFRDPQGMAALKLAAEDDSTSRRDDDELTVFGVNSGQHMLIYNTSLTAIAFYGREGAAIGEFRQPHGVGADAQGRVVVADTGNHRLHVLQYAGDALRHVRFIAGDFAGRPLRRPLGVAVEQDEIYVCDPEAQRILVLDFDGTLRRELRPERHGTALLVAPFAVAAIRADHPDNFFGEDFVIVTDSLQQRVWKLDRNGQPLAVRRSRDTGNVASEFYYCAIDYYGNVYCSDRGGRLHKFDRELQFLLSIGRPGRGDHELDAPRGIGLYRRFGQMFIAEREGAQYLWIGTDVFTPSVTDVARSADGRWHGVARFFLTEYASTRLDLVDAAGTVRVALQTPLWTAPGAVARRFAIDTDPSGLRLRVAAVPTYSSRKILNVEKFSQPVRAQTAKSR